jgi:hypothetical protein
LWIYPYFICFSCCTDIGVYFNERNNCIIIKHLKTQNFYCVCSVDRLLSIFSPLSCMSLLTCQTWLPGHGRTKALYGSLHQNKHTHTHTFEHTPRKAFKSALRPSITFTISHQSRRQDRNTHRELGAKSPKSGVRGERGREGELVFCSLSALHRLTPAASCAPPTTKLNWFSLSTSKGAFW